MNNMERRLWIENNEGLYRWRLSERKSITAFIKEHRAEIDELIKRKVNE